MAKQLGFYFDADVCTNCKACEVACQDKNDLPQNMRWPALTADIEPAESRLRRGAPVCTVMAQGATVSRARTAVARKALAVLARLDYA